MTIEHLAEVLWSRGGSDAPLPFTLLKCEAEHLARWLLANYEMVPRDE